MYTDDVWVGVSTTELTVKTKSSINKTTKSGSTLALAQSGSEGRLNDTGAAMKIGPAIGMYMPELAMILGGQELL